MKRLSIIGSAGSIGTQSLDVVRQFPDKFKVAGLASLNEVELVAKQAAEFKPAAVALADPAAAEKLRSFVPHSVKVFGGPDAASRIATLPEADTVVTAVVGAVGIGPTLEAIKMGKDIALANKETLVAAGALVMPAVRKAKVRLMPIDSEHSALFQCLNGEKRAEVRRLILTCSGGPFRGKTLDDLTHITVKQALGHPTWNMGAKITIDSSTLMNKGLEVIEAMWLYDVPVDQVDVVVHPQSIIHSMVEFVDGNVMAQLGCHDMRLPIQYALGFPDRLANDRLRLSFEEVTKLTFEKPDKETFHCLQLAYDAAHAGGTQPAVMNAANEVAVGAFLQKKAAFLDIPKTIEKVMRQCGVSPIKDLETVLAADAEARVKAREFLKL
ncbi:MAG TPA: 1-deoxy-D-xylulose-5-phosphate reductoisomerase [Elusimicrobia bacterium]|nr:1-deoxy-D-xylulose-5-phosphate reductoisomerase [Elusimicrobiota bacterium]